MSQDPPGGGVRLHLGIGRPGPDLSGRGTFEVTIPLTSVPA